MSVAEDLKEIFAKMPQAFRPDKARNLNATIQLELNGDGGGGWILKIADGALSVNEGQADSPNLTLRIEAGDYVALSHGEANPMSLFMAGKIKLEGDMGLAMKFQEMFNIGQEE